MNDWSPLIIHQHASDVAAKDLGNDVPQINKSADVDSEEISLT